jgi:hypothetical protein
LQQRDLVILAGVHRNSLRIHPESPKLQATLRDLIRVRSRPPWTCSAPLSGRCFWSRTSPSLRFAIRHGHILNVDGGFCASGILQH